MQASEANKYTEGPFEPIVEKCEGCERIIDVGSNKYCKTYIHPAAKWRIGICNFATHAKPELTLVTVRINPLKASKRASRRKK